MSSYILNFEGYLDDETLNYFPKCSGIYCVFAGIRSFTGNIVPRRLLYIGQATNLYDRHHSHNYHDNWLKSLRNAEELCYCYAKVIESELDILENALIFHHQPPENINGKESFDYNFAVILCQGQIGTLNGFFCIDRAA